jgi:hypothetical protein
MEIALTPTQFFPFTFFLDKSMSIAELLPALHGLSLEEKLQAMQFLCQDVEQFLVNGSDLSGDREVLTKVHDGLREKCIRSISRVKELGRKPRRAKRKERR